MWYNLPLVFDPALATAENIMLVHALVIIYNSSIEDSATLSSIPQLDLSETELTINIWNNGPIALNEEDISRYTQICQSKGIQVNIFQDLRNISLSKIYNYFLNEKNYSFISILDQDTVLNDDYFLNITQHHDKDLIIPQVFTGDTIKTLRYPHRLNDQEEWQTISHGQVTENISSVTSGIILTRHLIDKFENFRGYVFEERLGFYGIDVEFFDAIDKMKDYCSVEVYCVGSIFHSFACDDPAEENSPFRVRETYFHTLFNRNMNSKKRKISTVWVIFRDALRGIIKLSDVLPFLRFTFENIHPRSKYPININQSSEKKS